MKIAVASGKGGTGKTTVALALAQAAGSKTYLVDCDVEEPNCHLFTAGEPAGSFPVNTLLPEFVAGSCSGCGKCVTFCKFNALARLGKRVLVFPELCHGCAGCIKVCPDGALQEQEFNIGRIDLISAGFGRLASGVMNVGYSMAPPVIRQLKKFVKDAETVIFDAPPGTACPMVTTLRGCDYAVLVTEPTPFGRHDLELAYRTIAGLGVPCGVILNRAGENDDIITDFCRENQLELLLKIPYSPRIAAGYACGRTLLESMPELQDDFRGILQQIGGVK